MNEIMSKYRSSYDRSSGTGGGATLAAPPAPDATSCTIPDLPALKARQKATWESGDFGQVAKFTMPTGEEFMSRIELWPGARVLDAACGTGNLATIAARRGCQVWGLDIASNLIAQARERAQRESLAIDFTQGDVEAMPYEDASFDAVVSMFGVMFAPRPDVVIRELCRVAKPGGLIALANWTPTGFIGKMFEVFARHLPPPPGLPSPLLWGDEAMVETRFNGSAQELQLTPRIARFRFPFDPADTVDFFRRYYGPTQRAFSNLTASGQASLLKDLVELQTRHNVSPRPQETETPSEYLEIQVRLRRN
jgi:SAM-dependent methyltransferase